MRKVQGTRVDINGIVYYLPKASVKCLDAAIDLIEIDLRQLWPQLDDARLKVAVGNVIQAYLEQRT